MLQLFLVIYYHSNACNAPVQTHKIHFAMETLWRYYVMCLEECRPTEAIHHLVHMVVYIYKKYFYSKICCIARSFESRQDITEKNSKNNRSVENSISIVSAMQMHKIQKST